MPDHQITCDGSSTMVLISLPSFFFHHRSHLPKSEFMPRSNGWSAQSLGTSSFVMPAVWEGQALSQRVPPRSLAAIMRWARRASDVLQNLSQCQAKLSEVITKISAIYKDKKFVVVALRAGKDRTPAALSRCGQPGVY